MAVENGKTCKEHATSYITLLDSKARGYCQVRVIFDNYTKEASMKEHTRERRKEKSYVVQESTGSKDKDTLLAITKDSLTLYLSHQLIRYSAVKVMTATHQEVMKNCECEAMPSASTQEEVDTRMNYHAEQVASNGMNVHIYSQDMDVLLLTIRRTPLLGDVSAVIMDTSERRRNIYDTLGPEKSGALINWHALTGCDATGDIHEKGNKASFAAFKKARLTILIALALAREMNRPNKCYVAVKSFCDLVSVLVESKQRCSGVFCSSNSEMNKDLTNCHQPREHGLNTYAVPMSMLIYGTSIWY